MTEMTEHRADYSADHPLMIDDLKDAIPWYCPKDKGHIIGFIIRDNGVKKLYLPEHGGMKSVGQLEDVPCPICGELRTYYPGDVELGYMIDKLKNL